MKREAERCSRGIASGEFIREFERGVVNDVRVALSDSMPEI
jgi:hypothetical protein